MNPGRPGCAALLALVSVLGPPPGCVPAAGEPTVAAAPSRPHRGDPGPAPAGVQDAASGASSRRAAQLLATLKVRPRAARDGYGRDQFGPPWHDVDRNGCDTRDDILRRDMTELRTAGKRGCEVEAGVLADPYTGAQIRFERGRGASVDIDHVVALSDAWSTGAATWDAGTRVALANDPLNLLAVDASTNRAKGDADAAAWLPPNRGYRCAYVARQVAVKAKYGLWVTGDEHDAIARVLATCPDEHAPEDDPPPPLAAPTRAEAPRPPADEPTAPPRPRPAEASAKQRATDPDYGSCKDAKAHGAGPYHRGRDPEYDYYRDADGDGVVCE